MCFPKKMKVTLLEAVLGQLKRAWKLFVATLLHSLQSCYSSESTVCRRSKHFSVSDWCSFLSCLRSLIFGHRWSWISRLSTRVLPELGLWISSMSWFCRRSFLWLLRNYVRLMSSDLLKDDYVISCLKELLLAVAWAAIAVYLASLNSIK